MKMAMSFMKLQPFHVDQATVVQYKMGQFHKRTENWVVEAPGAEYYQLNTKTFCLVWGFYLVIGNWKKSFHTKCF